MAPNVRHLFWVKYNNQKLSKIKIENTKIRKVSDCDTTLVWTTVIRKIFINIEQPSHLETSEPAALGI